ncbi:MAG: hypothetical protein J6U97_04335, partial [Bacteroidaceae bacterium]|nr:hypothetical protein [Bacteroidaceae bacterium]
LHARDCRRYTYLIESQDVTQYCCILHLTHCSRDTRQAAVVGKLHNLRPRAAPPALRHPVHEKDGFCG